MNEKIEKALKDVREKTEDVIVSVNQFMQKHPMIASVIGTTAGALTAGAIAYAVGSNDGRRDGFRKSCAMLFQPLTNEHIESVTLYDEKGDKVWMVTDKYEGPNAVTNKYGGTSMDVKKALAFSVAAGTFRLKPDEAVTIMRVDNDLLIKK